MQHRPLYFTVQADLFYTDIYKYTPIKEIRICSETQKLLSVLFITLLNSVETFSQEQTPDSCKDNVNLYQSYQEYADGMFTDSICLSTQKHKFSVYCNKFTLKNGQQKRKYPHESLWDTKGAMKCSGILTKQSDSAPMVSIKL